jgi:hypothetical protein
VHACFPPGWEHGDPARATSLFTLERGARLSNGEGLLLSEGDDDGALAALDVAIRSAIALDAPDHVFIHAGVVACDGRALVLPGSSLAGKTTLVAALVRAGATYFSDEFAVLDRDGRVHPFPKPLSVREPGSFDQVDVPAAELGSVGSAAADVAVIANVQWAGSETALHPGSAGAGALALLAHAVPARTRPAAVLEAVCAAATGALYLEGARGEAEAAARSLLDVIAERASTLRDRPEQSAPALSGA